MSLRPRPQSAGQEHGETQSLLHAPQDGLLSRGAGKTPTITHKAETLESF